MKIPTDFRTIRLQGMHIQLRTPRSTDVQSFCRMYNDAPTMKHLQFIYRRKNSPARVSASLRQVRARLKKGISTQWGIFDSDQTFLGVCGFNVIKREVDAADFGIIIHKKYWGKGVGREAHLLALTFGFEKLRLNRIEFVTSIKNLPMRCFFKKHGFIEEGIQKQAFKQGKRYEDAVVYRALRSEWKPIKSSLMLSK